MVFPTGGANEGLKIKGYSEWWCSMTTQAKARVEQRRAQMLMERNSMQQSKAKQAY
jgi:hypothetical protein